MTAAKLGSSDGAQPYGSAADLPSFREMKTMIKGAKVLTLFIGREQQSDFVKIDADMNEMAATVDRFYELIGSRHWVFTDMLPLSQIMDLTTEVDDPEDFEARFIEIMRDRLAGKNWQIGLYAFEGLRARMNQLRRAREHFLAAQYDSCTLQILSAMDGFVNDFQPDVRQGLHAREADEMVAWDSVVGHHLGLTNALKPFRKSFKKRHDNEVFEVYRNGIVHGTVVNFDNAVVATKAWNLLYAVIDWAKATEKDAKAEPAGVPSLRESWESIKTTVTETSERKKHRDEWTSRAVVASDEGFAEERVVKRSIAFLDHWRRRNFGELGTYPMRVLTNDMSRGDAAKFAKGTFSGSTLEDFSLDAVTYTMPSVAELSGAATVNGEDFVLDLRWIYQNEAGDFLVPTQPGQWQLQHYAPQACLKPVEPPV